MKIAIDSGDEALLEGARDLADQLEDLGFSTDDNNESEEISLTVKQVENLSQSMLALQEVAEEPSDEEVNLTVNQAENPSDSMLALQATAEEPGSEETAALDNSKINWKPSIIENLKKIIDSIDKDGLNMVVEMKRQLNANTSGFDLLKTADGEKWSFVMDDGFHDKYNFGGRTMVVFDDQLYVGAANPFYGAQLWRIDNGKESETTRVYVSAQFKNTAGEKVALANVNGADGLTENDNGWLPLGYVDVAGEVTLDAVKAAIANGQLEHVYNTTLDVSQVEWTDLQSDVRATDAVEGTPDSCFHLNGKIPVYAVTYTDGVENETVFADQTYQYYMSGAATPDFAGTPSRKDYTFLGWGDHFSDAVSGDAIYTAQWTYAGGGSSGGSHSGGSTSYTITVADAENGSATASRRSASKGTTITVTATPDKGYELDTLNVTDKNGDKVRLTEKNGKYTFTMPASAVTVKATFTKTAKNPFTDVNDDAYYKDAVIWAVENGITKGTSGTMFSPDAACTRAQAVTFLWCAAGSPSPKSSTMPFTDVAADAYYHDAVLWAVENGITKGTSDTTFSPDVKCTRAQIVTFLWRTQKSPIAASVNVFTDVMADAYYADAVNWAVAKGITSGTSATAFSPNADCTRAQIVTFLYRSNNG